MMISKCKPGLVPVGSLNLRRSLWILASSRAKGSEWGTGAVFQFVRHPCSFSADIDAKVDYVLDV